MLLFFNQMKSKEKIKHLFRTSVRTVKASDHPNSPERDTISVKSHFLRKLHHRRGKISTAKEKTWLIRSLRYSKKKKNDGESMNVPLKMFLMASIRVPHYILLIYLLLV